MAKLQKFHDIRYGNTATLRVENEWPKPYALRVRDFYGHLHFMSRYATASEAKEVLERMEDPLCFGMCSFYTDDDSGIVEDDIVPAM